ncbi:hypothetical protein ONA00_05545 [Mycoplasmopsis cynos]|nr:hypothetical protein [Mycoplasmopsis cynos]WAM10765.1 hypothetical protein ONA00_05545 [Mycoplasmopsis cynos]
MTAKDFNKKYKLNLNNIENPFVFINKTNNFANVVGKPKSF